MVPRHKISYSHARRLCNAPRCCVQVLATVACNLVLLDLNLSLAYPTIVIAQLHQKAGPLSLNDVQASWLGKWQLGPPKSSKTEHNADLWRCVVLQVASLTSASPSAAWVQACWLNGSVVNVSCCSLTCLSLPAGCSCTQRRTTPFYASPASSWVSRLVSPRPPSTVTSARCANPRSVEWWRRAQVGTNTFPG